MKELKHRIQMGWPENKKDCLVEIRDFWNCRAELSVVNNIVMKGGKYMLFPYHIVNISPKRYKKATLVKSAVNAGQ